MPANRQRILRHDGRGRIGNAQAPSRRAGLPARPAEVRCAADDVARLGKARSAVIPSCIAAIPNIILSLELIVFFGLANAEEARGASSSPGNLSDRNGSITLPELSVSGPADGAFFHAGYGLAGSCHR
jgi:hypothetical protein